VDRPAFYLELADVLAKTGGWGVSAILFYVIFRQQRKVDQLQDQLTTRLLDVTKEFVRVLTENNIVAKQQMEMLRGFTERIDRLIGK